VTVFFLTFGLLGLTILAMSAGVLLAGKRITGSCGGLNTLAGVDKCLVCKQSVDPDSPLRDRLQCPRRKANTPHSAADPSGTTQIIHPRSLLSGSLSQEPQDKH